MGISKGQYEIKMTHKEQLDALSYGFKIGCMLVCTLCILTYVCMSSSYNKHTDKFEQNVAGAILSLDDAAVDVRERVKILEDMHKPTRFTITAYTAARDECDVDPGNTALMEEPKAGWTVAVSADYMHMLGKKVYIEGVGVRRINDLMNPRYTKRIDVLVPTKKQARRFGKKENVTVVFLTEEYRYEDQ